MKYLYSILLIVVAFLALPAIVDFSTSMVNSVILYVNTGNLKEVPEQRKARDYDLKNDPTSYTASAEKGK